jgi:hypothetical protein
MVLQGREVPAADIEPWGMKMVFVEKENME